MEIMNIGIVGLGRMGRAIAHRAVLGGYIVYGYDQKEVVQQEAHNEGVLSVISLKSLAEHVSVILCMLPAGEVVDEVIDELLLYIKSGTIIIDGGNSHFSDSIRRYLWLKEAGHSFIDCGTSGGLHAREIGFSLMIGGDYDIFKKIEALFTVLATKNGYAYLGASGAGHYVKMVHNGIEYALLQSYAEGLDLLHHGRYKDLNLADVTRVWSHGSIIRSYINDLAADIYKKGDQNFDKVKGIIGGGTTGRWTVEEASTQGIPVPLIREALKIREQSNITGGTYATKLVALLRNAFGGHPYETT
jgi:6-phosphogluconate dehydrogenase